MKFLSFWKLAICGAAVWLGLSGSSLKATEVDCAGLELRLSEEWRAESPERGAGVQAWARTDRDGVLQDTLRVSVRKGYTPILPGGRDRLARSVEQELGCRAGVEGVEVREVTWLKVGAVPAFRVRVGFRRIDADEELALEELIYVLGGRDTVLLTFCTTAERYASQGPGFERIVTTAGARAQYLFAMPPWFCCALLGGLAGLSAAVRRRLPVGRQVRTSC